MPTPPSSPPAPPAPPARRKARRKVDRRAPEGATGPGAALRKLKGALTRPLTLEKRNGQLHLVLVERRRGQRGADAKPTREQICAELSLRLLVNDAEDGGATGAFAHALGLVHDALAQQGWAGVDRLPPRLLAQAIGHAAMLLRDERSPALRHLIDRLRVAQAAARARAERRAAAGLPEVQVSEVSADEFEEAERVWTATTSKPPPGSL